jgi:Ni,Fe-hydrogenase I cytochrome b subunit
MQAVIRTGHWITQTVIVVKNIIASIYLAYVMEVKMNRVLSVQRVRFKQQAFDVRVTHTLLLYRLIVFGRSRSPQTAPDPFEQ